jgi:hypothetical protein
VNGSAQEYTYDVTAIDPATEPPTKRDIFEPNVVWQVTLYDSQHLLLGRAGHPDWPLNILTNVTVGQSYFVVVQGDGHRAAEVECEWSSDVGFGHGFRRFWYHFCVSSD